MLGDRLGKLTQFDQGGIRITGEGPLCRRGQLHEQWVVLLQEIEVG